MWISHIVYFTHENSKSEATERCEHKNNNKRVARNLEEMNVSTKGKNPKEGLTSAEDLSIDLPEERESSYYRLD